MKRLFPLVASALINCIAVSALPSPRREDCRNGEFQFSATFNNGGVDGSTARDFTAYLWIPPACERLRGVIVTQENVGEQAFTEHPAIREACAKHDLAIVWCCPAFDLRFQKDRARAAQLLETVLTRLGLVSGYEELGSVPWISFGHSTTVTFARNLAEAMPIRTIAVLSAKGGIDLPDPDRYSGPVIYTAGQYPEWRQPTHDWTTNGRSLEGLKKIREAQAEQVRPLSYVEEYGGGHFDYSDRYLEFLALYIDKALQYRLNPDGSLRSIGKDEGYVVDMRPPVPLPPLTVMPLAKASGELRNAPWFFDQEIAEAAVTLMAGNWERENQIVAFANLDGTPATFSKSGIVDPVPCEMAEDGVTIKRIETIFLDQLPSNFTQAGMKLGHAASGNRTIERVSGAFAIEDGQYRIKLNRGYPETPSFIAVRHPGDAQYRPSVQPGRLAVPAYPGRKQQIAFEEITDQKVGTKSILLRATSSAGVKVEFFVRAGPAKVAGNKLIFLPLPPRTHFPIKLTVVAWQLGRGGADPVAAAPMAERTFFLNPNQ